MGRWFLWFLRTNDEKPPQQRCQHASHWAKCSIGCFSNFKVHQKNLHRTWSGRFIPRATQIKNKASGTYWTQALISGFKFITNPCLPLPPSCIEKVFPHLHQLVLSALKDFRQLHSAQRWRLPRGLPFGGPHTITAGPQISWNIGEYWWIYTWKLQYLDGMVIVCLKTRTILHTASPVIRTTFFNNWRWIDYGGFS